MRNSRLRFGNTLGLSVAILGIYVVAREICSVLNYRYLHIDSVSKLAVFVMLWTAVAAIYVGLAISALRAYPAGSLVLIGSTAAFSVLIGIICTFFFELETATNSFTEDPIHLGCYDRIVEDLINCTPNSNIFPAQLPEGSDCIFYSYLYESYISDSFEIHLVCQFDQNGTYEQEIQRLKSFSEDERGNQKMEVGWLPDADALIIKYYIIY